jgi:hypothetical protein
VKPRILYRISSVLLLLFAAGHTFGFRQNDPEWGADAVVGLMHSVHFNAQGFTRIRAPIHRVSFVRSGCGLATGRTSSRDLRSRAQHCVGARHLLCSSHSVELEIHLHHPDRFLSPDYSVPDRCGVALSEVRMNQASDTSDLRPSAEPRGPIRPEGRASRMRRLFGASLTCSDVLGTEANCRVPASTIDRLD